MLLKDGSVLIVSGDLVSFKNTKKELNINKEKGNIVITTSRYDMLLDKSFNFNKKILTLNEEGVCTVFLTDEQGFHEYFGVLSKKQEDEEFKDLGLSEQDVSQLLKKEDKSLVNFLKKIMTKNSESSKLKRKFK